MPSPAASTNSIRNVMRRFRRSRRGSAAVEFAIVAPVFFVLLFAILETAIVFFAGQVLESITQKSARTLLTGQTQTAGLSQSTFHDTVVCGQIPALFTCANVYVDVRSYPAFSNVSITPPIDASNNFDSTQMKYTPGGPGQITVVRVFYKWPLVVTGLGYNIANLAGNWRLLGATAAFQNEPF